jgi:hypothetical protein
MPDTQVPAVEYDATTEECVDSILRAYPIRVSVSDYDRDDSLDGRDQRSTTELRTRPALERPQKGQKRFPFTRCELQTKLVPFDRAGLLARRQPPSGYV